MPLPRGVDRPTLSDMICEKRGKRGEGRTSEEGREGEHRPKVVVMMAGSYAGLVIIAGLTLPGVA